MDPTVANVVALAISFLALAVSGVLALQQFYVMRRANEISVISDLMQEFRSSHFKDAEFFVLEQLADAHEVALGCTNLPRDDRMMVETVTSFYSGLGSFLLYGMVDENLIVTTFGFRGHRVWVALEERIAAERALRGDPNFATAFEDFVCRVRAEWPPVGRYRTPPRSLS